MAIAPFNKDMDIIQQLDDEPNDVGGLTAQELKEKFDEGGNALKNYINQTLIPALEGLGVNAIIRTGSEGSLRYLRLNSDKVLESSADGAVWEATGSSGHIIVGQDGTQLPQRSRLQFVGCEVSDDAGATVVQIGAVPTTRTVNGKPLSGDITLTAADVGALPLEGGIATGELKYNGDIASMPQEWSQETLVTKRFVEVLLSQASPASALAAYDKTIKGTYPIATGNSVTAGDVVDVVDGEVTRSVVTEANVKTVFSARSTGHIAVCKLNDQYSVVAFGYSATQGYVCLLENKSPIPTPPMPVQNMFYNGNNPILNISLARLSDTKIVVSWSISNQIYTRLATIVESSISFKNTVQPTGNNSEHPCVVALDTDRFAIFYSSVGADGIDVNVGTVSGDTITYPGNGYSKSGCVPQYISATLLPNDSSGNKRVCVCFSDANDNNKGKAVIVTINSSNVVTWGSVVTFNNSESHSISCASNGNTVVVSYNNDSACYCRVLAVNGTSITAGSQTQFKTTEIRAGSFVVCISGKFVVLGYGYASGAIISGSYAIVLNVSGLNITVNTAYQFDTASASGLCACPISDNKLIAAYIDNGNNNYGTSTILEVNGNQIAGGFAMNSTQAIALQSGEAGQEIEVIFAGTTAADFITEGQKIPSDGVYGYGPMAGWLNVIPYWAKEARIATGSYVGTGTYGASNPNSLTFQVDPKLVIIRAQPPSSYDKDNMAIFIKPVLNSTSMSRMQKAAGQVLGATILCTWDKNTLTWYSTATQDEQLNSRNATYYYLVIG